MVEDLVLEKKQYAFFEGKYVPLEDAKISIMTSGFLYGTAVFEGLRGYWNEQKEEIYIFRLREHFERMMDSLKIMHMHSKFSVDELCKMTVELVQSNAPRGDTYIRPTAYKSACKIGPSLENNPTEICMFTVPFGDYFHGADGLQVQISSWRRVEDNAIPARAKTDALTAGFDECIVLAENGHVSEGSAMNIFMVKRGKLITTPVTENILEGITRGTIIEMVEQELGMKTECRQIDRSELYCADEAFFCGTGAQIAPIRSIDKRPVGDGTVGPISAKVRDLYISVCRGEQAKYLDWLTPCYNTTGIAGTASAKSTGTAPMST